MVLHLSSKRIVQAFLMLAFCLPLHSVAQSSAANVEVLQQIAQRENERFEREKSLALTEAETQEWPVTFSGEDSTEYELIRVEDGVPVYYQTLNVTAAASTSTNHVWTGGRTGFNLNGSGMVMREWDGGGTRVSHQEFGARVTQVDNPSGFSNHATHVAGTLVASGVDSSAKGMAYAASLRAFDWNNDNSEMASEAASGALVSNHSYGQVVGWAFGNWSGNQGWHWFGSPNISQNEDWKFGFYNAKARTWDEIAENAPHYLIVKSAGNNRGQGISSGSHYAWNGSWQLSTTSRELSGGSDGYDCIPTYGTAKNILTVGAVFDVPNGYAQPSDVVMPSFSSWGPTDDGRIKPDVVGNGVGVYSSYAGSNTQYASISGTSMSGPNVAGSLLLLQQLHDSLTNSYMRSATLRGLAIHTADEAGPNLGPDYMFGWGLLNTEKAANVLVDSTQAILLEETLAQGDTFRLPFESDGVTPICVTLCWTDPSAPANSPALNPSNIKLINDLDVRIVNPANPLVNEMPWILNPAAPSAAATRGDNIRDNVEVVPAGVLPAGMYEIVVTHKGTLQQYSSSTALEQPFSLIGSGIEQGVCITNAPSVNINKTTAIACLGDSTAVLEANATGGAPPYTYAWNGDSTLNTPLLSGLPAGLHYVNIYDANNCMAVDTMIVSDPPVFMASVSVSQNVSCYGGNDGSVQLTAIGGTPPYAYSWNTTPVQTTASATNLTAGTYTATVTDSNNCSVIVAVSITEPSDSLGVSLTDVQHVDCYGDSSGSITVDATGGTPPYTYAWNTTPAQAGSTANDLPTGTYMVSVTDSNLCQTSMSVSVNQPVSPVAGSVASVDSVTCFGGSDGSANVSVTGGHSPYSYLWNSVPPQTSSSASNLSSGVYQVLITDSSGCVDSVSVLIPQPSDSIDVSVLAVNDVSCRGGNDGSIVVSSTGGLLPHTYEWNTTPVQMGDSISNLPVGTYNVTVTDANGCSMVKSVEVEEPLRLNSTVFSRQDVSCYGAEDGIVDVNVSGGTPPYSFVWSHGASTSTLNNLSGGTYTLTVTDANGCSDSLSETIAEPYTFPIGAISGPIFTGPSQIEEYSIPPQSGASYSWVSQGGSVVAGQGTREVSIDWAQFGMQALTVTVTSGDTCDQETLMIEVNADFSLSESAVLSSVRVYPNPTTGVLTIELPDPSMAEMIEVFDAAGKRVFITTELFETQSLDLSILAAGAYTLRVGVYNQRIIIVK